MKKKKLPGENISLKTKKNEAEAIMEWLNCQSNLMDSIRYLIENEIRANGVRNLQQFIPADRNFPLTGPVTGEAGAAAPAYVQGLSETAAAAAPPEEEEIDEEDIESWI
ncbi:hypothetical protein ABEV74_13050 [Paenibacillus cisolokensis]|uniref:hypothetical protein n=1 Tax=Paenibacillus TaxID=44249 RepID=UPI00071F4367|nr:hypothetical protein [Paenibacillus sp. 32O-W]ALS25925.1 hypothetical protein IJ21_04930 [Paenibacillus sp. 32O-W]